MNKTIVTYETFHGSAKKVAEIVSEVLAANLINIDTPFEAEDLKEIDNIVMVFNFRGPYTAQLTKLYLGRVKDQLRDKNVVLVGEGLFSEKEFPVVAEEISKLAPSKTFNKFFVNGQLRMDVLSKEEKVLLDKFAELTKMEIKDMGELDLDKASKVAEEIKTLFEGEAKETKDKSEDDAETDSKANDKADNAADNKSGDATSETKWKCPLCGYIHTGPTPPDVCPLCGAPGNTFIKLD